MAEESPREDLPEVSAEDSKAIFDELKKQGLKTDAESADGTLSRQNTRLFDEPKGSALENMGAVHEEGEAAEEEYADDFEESADQMGGTSRQNTASQNDESVAASARSEDQRTENAQRRENTDIDPYADSSVKEISSEQSDPYPNRAPVPEYAENEKFATDPKDKGSDREEETNVHGFGNEPVPTDDPEAEMENNGDTANIVQSNNSNLSGQKTRHVNSMNGVADADLLFDAVADNVFSVVEGEEIKDLDVQGNSPFTWGVEFGEKLLKLDGSTLDTSGFCCSHVMIFYAALKCPHTKAAAEGIERIVKKIKGDHGENAIESIMVTPEEKTLKGAMDVAADCKYTGYIMDVESYSEHMQSLISRLPVRGYPTVPVITNMRDVITSDAAGFLTLNNYYTWWKQSILYELDQAEVDMEKYTTALEEGDEDTVWEMIKNGATTTGKITKKEDDIEVTSTPILLAKKNLTIVAMLLQNGASPYDVDSDGNTVLLSACNGGDIDIVNVLLVNGLDLNHVPPKVWVMQPKGYPIPTNFMQSYKGFGPLHACCSNLETECAKYLLKMGANPTLKSADGKSPRDILQDFFYDEELDNELLDYERIWAQRMRNR